VDVAFLFVIIVNDVFVDLRLDGLLELDFATYLLANSMFAKELLRLVAPRLLVFLSKVGSTNTCNVNPDNLSCFVVLNTNTVTRVDFNKEAIKCFLSADID
jgi:hypothetical protein